MQLRAHRTSYHIITVSNRHSTSPYNANLSLSSLYQNYEESLLQMQIPLNLNPIFCSESELLISSHYINLLRGVQICMQIIIMSVIMIITKLNNIHLWWLAPSSPSAFLPSKGMISCAKLIYNEMRWVISCSLPMPDLDDMPGKSTLHRFLLCLEDKKFC